MMKILNNFNLIALGIIVGLFFVALQQCSKIDNLNRENTKLKYSNDLLTNNIKVSNDTMRYWQDKHNNNLSEISILTANKELLENNYTNIYSKYKELIRHHGNSQELVAYLTTQINIKDSIIDDLKINDSIGSTIINDSTILVDINKFYDANNFYDINGRISTSIRDNRILAGSIELYTNINMGLELGISRDPKSGIASLTTKTPFPAKVALSGITAIEQELNKKPTLYIGLSLVAGYGIIPAEESFKRSPFFGVAAYISPRWLTIKVNNK